MTSKPVRAVGYIRVSTPGQAKKEEKKSLDIQKEVIEKHCKSNKLELLSIYEDAGISGAKSDRPDLMKLLEDARAKKFDAVIVHSLSRFGRFLMNW